MRTLSLIFVICVLFIILSVHIKCDTKWLLGQQFKSQTSNGSWIFFDCPNFHQRDFNATSSRDFLRRWNHLNVDNDGVKKLENERRGEECLKNLDECYEKDSVHFVTSANRLSALFFNTNPPFDLSRTPNVSPTCRQQSRKYMDDLKDFKLWALKIYDSSAKMPSGILNGNINQLGDFDLCLQAHEKSKDIRGQYCLASLQIDSPGSPYMSALHRLMQSHFHFKSEMSDPGHRVPKFSSINWALCVPSECSANDVKIELERTVKRSTAGTGLTIQVNVDPNMCQSNIKREIPFSTKVAGSIFAFVIVAVLCAAIYDHVAVGEKNQWITAFSLTKNFSSILSKERQPGDIEAIHGIRFLNALLLVFAHKSMAVMFVPFTNRTEMTEYIARPWTVLGRAASLYTDPFIMFSGTLTAYSFLGKLQKFNRINVAEEYASRLFRILPSFVALIAFCTFVLPFTNNGPMWNLVVSQHSDICKRHWWRNLLFIHNYFGFEDMCLTHTHHVGIDTQLFFASPFLVLLLWKWPRSGSAALVLLAALSTVLRYYVTYTMNLSNYIHFGTSIKQLFATADNMYILPVHRATVYIMGIFLALILRKSGNIALKNSHLRLGNAAAALSLILAFFGPAFMGSIEYKYHPVDAAWYAAFAPIFWCFAFGWIVFRAHTGNKGFLENFFSHPVFLLWTKISYAVYLVQFPVFFYNVGTVRAPEHYEFFTQMLALKEYLSIVFFSTILTLLFEMPFQNVRNLIFQRRKRSESANKLKNK